jgi:PAS domain S-box-containing protein
MPPIALETVLDRRNRTPLLVTSAAMIAVIALVDWWTLPYVSLGFLYLFPIMLAAGFLPRPMMVALGVLCAIFSEAFSSLDPSWRVSRLALAALALVGCGLFVQELLRNRRLTLETQQRLRGLVETSPAAIITVDEHGSIDLANHAAVELLAPKQANLVGEPIARFVPELQSALRHGGAQLRTSMQCQVHRGDGETVAAEAWFSTYSEKGTPKLTAIIVDMSEEQPQGQALSFSSDSDQTDHVDHPTFSSRQVEVLRLVFEGLTNNQIASQLGVTSSAVRNTLQQLFTKTGVKNRSQMVRVALERYGDLL